VRRAALLAAALALPAGCGADEPEDRPSPSVTAVKRCLEKAGLTVEGGAFGSARPDDEDAPDVGELVVPGAFLAFYSTEALADRLAPGIRKNAERLDGDLRRHGKITVLFVSTEGFATTGDQRVRIEGCV
jgi:hypothetical protein